MSTPPSASDPRPTPGVRTTRRRGRTSPTKERVLAEVAPRWSVGPDGWSPGALRAAFGTDGPLLVDIGVGDGEATRAWGRDHPTARVLAIELHRPGLAKLVTRLDRDGPSNVRVAEADATEVVGGLPRASATAIRVLFPDPWPKRRHVRRRLVDRRFVTQAADALAAGGELALATDWPEYADHMRSMVAAEPRLVAEAEGDRPARPVTAYERRGLDAGRPIADLRYRRSVEEPSTST